MSIDPRYEDKKAYRERTRAAGNARSKAWARTAKGRFRGHANGAKRRGIAFDFTFETWLAWWGDDLDKMGKLSEQLCCARRGDTGPYSPDNCVKLPNAVNHKHRNRRRMIRGRV